MHNMKDKLRSVDWRDGIMKVAGLSNLVLIGAMVYFLAPLSGDDIALIILVSAVYTLFLWRAEATREKGATTWAREIHREYVALPNR